MEAFTAAKNMASVYGMFFKAVAQEIGMERALTLQSKANEGYVTTYIELFKEPDLKKVAAKVTEMSNGLGMIGETKVEGRKVVSKYTKCPIYDGFLEAGISNEQIKTYCQHTAEEEYDSFKKILHNVKGSLTRFRSSPDDYCIEDVEVRK